MNPRSVCLWGGVGVLNCTVDHIQQEFYTLFLTRFRTYKIASPPQTKMISKDDIKGLVSLKFLRPYLTLSHQITLQCVPHSTEELWLRLQSFQDCSAAETHIQRQAALHNCLPRLLGDGANKFKKVYGEEKNILYWTDQSSQGRIKVSCAGTTSRGTNQGRTPFICTLWVLIFCLSLNSQQGPPLSCLSGFNSQQGPLLSSLSGFNSQQGSPLSSLSGFKS